MHRIALLYMSVVVAVGANSLCWGSDKAPRPCERAMSGPFHTLSELPCAGRACAPLALQQRRVREESLSLATALNTLPGGRYWQPRGSSRVLAGLPVPATRPVCRLPSLRPARVWMRWGLARRAAGPAAAGHGRWSHLTRPVAPAHGSLEPVPRVHPVGVGRCQPVCSSATALIVAPSCWIVFQRLGESASFDLSGLFLRPTLSPSGRRAHRHWAPA